MMQQQSRPQSPVPAAGGAMTLSRTWFYLLPLLLFPVLWAEPRSLSGSHSLLYSYSFLSKPLPGVPQYSVFGYVDEVPIMCYTSESLRLEPRAPWMENITDEEPQYWEEIKKTLNGSKETLNNTLRNLMKEKNQSMELQVLQVMAGCELREDGSVKWFQRSAYNGSNYNEAEDRGNSEGQAVDCEKELKNLLEYGEESLRRRVTPQTRVSRKKANDRTFLMGYAYGFYPRDIEVKWVHDGVEIPWESNELLPNPDGTYQVRTEVEVQEGDDVRTYEYHVNHSSLPETVNVTVEYEEKSPPLGVIIGGVIGALVGVGSLAAVVWVIYSRKKTSGHCWGPEIKNYRKRGGMYSEPDPKPRKRRSPRGKKSFEQGQDQPNEEFPLQETEPSSGGEGTHQQEESDR